ncbi:MAG TPA: bifunctional 4-hydroxy-2-oxoglutarate aldolase/2-dehydro-3-deoxy-phosphogluconate aldolase [Sphingobacteriaceae bacterium]
MKKEKAFRIIAEQRVLPLFFEPSAVHAASVLEALYRAGIRTIEYTNRGPEALATFTKLKRELESRFPDLQLGAGTILSVEQARQFMDCGADYIVSPAVVPEVGDFVHSSGLLWIPGCMTPTEIYSARTSGASLIKIFPGSVLGPSYISQIRELFPGQEFMVTGGVEPSSESLAGWFQSGVSVVGIGSKLITKSIVAEKNWDLLYEKTRQLIHLADGVAAP